MYVNGSRITSQFQRENKRLNMHMSKHLQLSFLFALIKRENIKIALVLATKSLTISPFS